MAPNTLHKSTPPFSRTGHVYLIDDDEDILSVLSLVLQHHGYSYMAFKSAADFLENFAETNPRCVGPACVVSDVNMPEINGLALQKSLKHLGDPPLVLMSGLSSPKEIVEAFRNQTIDFLVKPFDNDELLRTVEHALEISRATQVNKQQFEQVKARYETLSKKEVDIASLVHSGLTSQQVADRLNIGLRTVKLYRQKIMEKLHVSTHTELIALLNKLSQKAQDLNAAS